MMEPVIRATSLPCILAFSVAVTEHGGPGSRIKRSLFGSLVQDLSGLHNMMEGITWHEERKWGVCSTLHV